MGDLAEKYGYGFVDGGEMLAVADPKEVWIFEIMPVGPLWTPESGKPGAVWCAQRVPDDEVSVCPNESRIGEIDLADKDFFLASPNVVSFAVEQKLYDPASGKPFNWKRAYSPGAGSALSTSGRRQRMWRFFRPRRPVARNSPPTSRTWTSPSRSSPTRSSRRQDVMTLTRDKSLRHAVRPGQRHPGRPLPEPELLRRDAQDQRLQRRIHDRHAVPGLASRRPSAGSSGCPGAPRTRPATCRFTPGSRPCPKSFDVGDHWEFNRASARWAFDYVDFHAQVVYSRGHQGRQEGPEECEGGAVAEDRRDRQGRPPPSSPSRPPRPSSS